MILKNSLYAKYIQEREGAEIIESEHGFISYKFLGDQCLVLDMFVEKSSRGNGHFKGLFSELEQKAKNAFCVQVCGRIFLADKNHKTTLFAVLSIGCEIARADGDCFYIIKKLDTEV
jgi:hypothetical protein